MPYGEVVEALRVGLLDLDIINASARRALPHQGNQLFYRFGITFQLRLDRSVAAVARPSANADRPGLVSDPGAKEHALHATPDADVPGNAHHTVEISGASSAFMPTTL
jgi:hypothetical protein